MRIEQEEHSTIVLCEKRIDNTTILEQQGMLAAALNYKKNIRINAKELSRINTAGFQLLLNFCRAAEKNNLNVDWETVSEQVFEMALTLGMSHLLGLEDRESR